MRDDDFEHFDFEKRPSIMASRRFWVASLLILSIGGFFLWVATRPNAPPARLDSFGCAEGVKRSTTLVVLDATDPLSPYQRSRFKEIWPTIIDKIHSQDFVGVGYVGSRGDLPFRGCKPDEGLWDVLTGLSRPNEDPNSVRATFSKTFLEPINKIVDGERLGGELRWSPILGTIKQDVDGLEDFWGDAEKRHLVVVSDLVENDPKTFTIGQFSLDARYQRKLERRADYPFLPSLKGTDVQVYYLRRPAYRAIQGTRHKNFWKGMLTEAGASSVRFEDLTSSDPRGGA